MKSREQASPVKIDGFEQALEDFLKLTPGDLKDLNPHYTDATQSQEKLPQTQGRRKLGDGLKSSHASR